MSEQQNAADGVVLVEDRGAVLEITLNRPEKLNALNQDVADALGAAWRRFEEGPWGAAVLTGAGDRAFCAGADFTDPPSDDAPAYPNFGVRLSKPVVAAVEGYAVGGGFVLSQASDIVVAGRSATFRYPEAGIGVTGGGATFISTRVPTKAVADLLLTARPYGAEQALRAGLVSEVVEDGRALAVARELAETIAGNDDACVRALKALIDRDTQRSTVESAQTTANLTAGTRDRSALEAVRRRHGK